MIAMMWVVLDACCPAGEWVQEVGCIYIDDEAIVVKQATTDMQNILGLAANGDVEAMQYVYAEQGSMVRPYRHGAVLPAMPAISLPPQHCFLRLRWMAFRTRLSSWCGCALLYGCLWLQGK